MRKQRDRMGKKGVGGVTITFIISIFIAVVLTVVLFTGAADLVPELQTAGSSLQATNAPLANLAAPNGVVTLALMATIVIGTVAGLFLLLQKMAGGRK